MSFNPPQGQPAGHIYEFSYPTIEGCGSGSPTAGESDILDGVIYKRVGSDFAGEEGTHVLFYDQIRTPAYREDLLAMTELPTATALQGRASGTWNSSTQTFTLGGTLLGGVAFHGMYQQITHSHFYAVLGDWTVPIDPSTGAGSFEDFPAGGRITKDFGYQGQMLSVLVPQYLHMTTWNIWSDSGLDPRQEDRPQDLNKSIISTVVSSFPEAPVDAQGNGAQDYHDLETENAVASSNRMLELEAVVDIDSITVSPSAEWTATLPLPTASDMESWNSTALSEYSLPFNFSLYQK